MGEGKGNENIPWIYKGINFQTLGKQIKKYRVLRGLRQSDLAELVFSTTNTISRIEIGGIGCSLENLANCRCVGGQSGCPAFWEF